MSGIFNLQNLNINGIASTTGSGSIIATSCTGNAATATTLQTAITIGGVSFNGSANINLPGVDSSGNQNTSGNAATATTALRITATNGNIATKNTIGVAGTIQYDDNYLYVCVATNSWIRLLRNNLGGNW